MKQGAHSTDGYVEQVVFDPQRSMMMLVHASADILVRAALGDEFYVTAPSDVADLRDKIMHTALVTAPPLPSAPPSAPTGRGRG